MSHCDACEHLEKPAASLPCSGCYGGDAFSMRQDLTDTRDRISKLESDLAEADRRAGAAERMLESEKDTTFRHRQWTKEAKKAWGVDDRLSFDKVWAEALALKSENAHFRKILQALVDLPLSAYRNKPAELIADVSEIQGAAKMTLREPKP